MTGNTDKIYDTDEIGGIDSFCSKVEKEGSAQGGSKSVIEDHEKVYEVELSLRKRFHKKIFSPFAKALNKYELLKEGDKVAVCISGGKDSMLLAKCFQEIKRHNKFSFELEFLSMDPGYNGHNRKLLEKNAELLGVPLKIFNTDIFDSVVNVEKSPCYLCARMRRGYLYSKAKELGCNKIALGHHLNDAIETTVMSMFYSSKLETIIPKSHSENFAGMELIRPMYCIKEEDIIAWSNANGLSFIQCACRFTENSTIDERGVGTSKRREVKELLKRLKETNPEIEDNIFRALHAVRIESFPGYKADGQLHSFLEDYDRKGHSFQMNHGENTGNNS